MSYKRLKCKLNDKEIKAKNNVVKKNIKKNISFKGIVSGKCTKSNFLKTNSYFNNIITKKDTHLESIHAKKRENLPSNNLQSYSDKKMLNKKKFSILKVKQKISDKSIEKKSLITNLNHFSTNGSKDNHTPNSNKNKTKVIFMEKDIDLAELYNWSFVSGSELLGEGTYGRVYKMIQPSNGEVRAFKRIFLEPRGFPSWLIRELSFLSFLKHPNIINLLQIFIGPERIYLSFPYINGGSLMDLMCSNYKDGMPKPLIKVIMKQILGALSHCHQNRIIHRDLKPENILCQLDNEQNFKNIFLADFGLARSFRWPNQNLSPEVITLYYRPIELLLGMSHYTSAVDMWSVGCILLELLIGPANFRSIIFGDNHLNEFSAVLKLIQTFGFPNRKEWPDFYKLSYSASSLPKLKPKLSLFDKVKEIRKDFDSSEIDILSKLLVLNPDRRLCAEKALEHSLML